MNIPVEAASTLFAPHPIRAVSPLKHRDERMIQPGLPVPPAIISDFFKGWASYAKPSEEEEYFSSVELDDRPGVPPPDADTPVSLRSSRAGSVRPSGDEDANWYPSAYRRRSSGETSFSTARSEASSEPSFQRERCNSIAIGNQVNELLQHDDVKQAVKILQEAIDCMNLADDEQAEMKETGKDHPPSDDVAKIYSRILKTLCSPNITKIVGEISHVDISKKSQLNDSVIWRLFTKVNDAGYQLEHDAHIAVVIMLMDNNHRSLALQSLYLLSRNRWKTSTYMLAITLHMMQTPKQVQEAEGLLSDYGKDYIEMANPLSPVELPPIRIETPLMRDVTDRDRLELWMYYQKVLDDPKWNREKDVYEARRRKSEHGLMAERRSSLKDWALRRMSLETETQRFEREVIDADNAMIYTAANKKQFEYGWQVFERMKDAVNEFTPRVAMHLCWCGHQDAPLLNTSRRVEWESRAWSLYSQFMCSEHLHPEQAETPGFLCDLLSITATSSENFSNARYTKAMSVYKLLKRLQLQDLLCNEQVLTPILCTLLMECKGSPTYIVTICHKAFDIWRAKLKAEQILQKQTTTTFSFYWALLVFCVKSGDVRDFRDVLEYLSKEEALPTSLLAPIQEFHDRHLCTTKGETCCYFDHYLFRAVKYTEVVEMDNMGFVVTPYSDDNSDLTEPMASIKYALHKRTNISETQATSLAMAAAIGAAKDEHISQHPAYYTPNKARALIRHCLSVTRSNQHMQQ